MRKWFPSVLGSKEGGSAGGYNQGSSSFTNAGSTSVASGAEQDLAKAFYEEDVKLLRDGMRLLFTNQMEEAETLFRGGFLTPAGTVRPPLPAYATDNRASFAFPYALSAMFRGLASLENEQLRDCLQRFRTCEEICNSSVEWLGQKLIRGVIALGLGIVELSMQSYGRGAVHVVKAWWLLKGVEEEVDSFDGPERLEVRSMMQLTCGAIEVAVSSLPPGLLRAAKFVGFKGEMPHARELIWRCYTEDGLLAPVAALLCAMFLVEVKPSIGVPPTAEDLRIVEDILEWADERFRGSCFFLMVRAALLFQRRQLAMCAACTDELEPLVKTYPAFALLVHWTRGRNALLRREWCVAGEHYEAAIDVHVKVQRRSWVPCMAMLAGLAYAAGGDTVRRDALWSIVMAHKAMNKSNWRDEDMKAFDMVHMFIETPPVNPDIELLYLLKCMAQLRGLPEESSADLVADLQGRASSFDGIDAVRSWLVQAEIFRVNRVTDQALDAIGRALSFVDTKSLRMAKLGLLPEIWLTKAVVCISANRLDEARASLKEIKGEFMKGMYKADRMDFDFRKNAVNTWLVERECATGNCQAPVDVDEAVDGDNEDSGFWSADEEPEDSGMK